MKIDALIGNMYIKKGENTIKRLSPYSKSIVSDQINSITYMLKSFPEKENYQDLINNQKLLKSQDLISFDALKKQIKFYGKKYNYTVNIDDNKLLLELENVVSGEQEHTIKVDTAQGIYVLKGIKNTGDIENFIEELTYVIDKAVSQLMRSPVKEHPKPYIPTEETSKKLAELNKVLSSKTDAIKHNADKKDAIDLSLLEEIKTEYLNVKKFFKQIATIKYKNLAKIKNEKYISEHPFDRHLNFRNIGPNSETMSLLIKSNKGKLFTELKINKENGSQKKFIINRDGKVIRNLSYAERLALKLATGRNSIPKYYTQQEIENENLCSYLQILNKELKSFSAYLQDWCAKRAQFKEMHSSTNMSELENQELKIKNIYNNFIQYKKNITKAFSSQDKRNNFKKQNNFGVEKNARAIIFNEADDNENTLRLSFPSVPNHGNAMQILVLNNEEIKDTFYVLENKLLKLKIKTLQGRLKHYDRNLYFYSKDYIEQSPLYKYIDFIQEKLEDINSKLNNILQLKREKHKKNS